MSGKDRMLPASAAHIVDLLGLEPLPDEGGLYRQTHIDHCSTAIYYLLLSPEISAIHRLAGPEIYHWYAGDPLELALLGGEEGFRDEVLGPDLAAGQRPQIVVPGGIWQGSRSSGSWTLLGTTMAPGFTWDHFTLGDRAELIDQFPQAARTIRALTRA